MSDTPLKPAYIRQITRAFQRMCTDGWLWYKFMPVPGGEVRLALMLRPTHADVVMPVGLRREIFPDHAAAVAYVTERGGVCL